MSQIPAKIVLKSTTKMSLNDRFTNIQNSRPAPQATVQNIRAKMVAQQQASVANRRLALQMANRPTVQAALRVKKQNLKSRLGVKGRLNLNAVQDGQVGGGEMRGRGGGRNMSRGRGGFRGGRGQRGGGDGGRIQTGGQRGMRRGRGGGDVANRTRGGFGRGRGGRGNYQNQGMDQAVTGGGVGGGGGFRGGRGRGFRGRGGQGGNRGTGQSPMGRGRGRFQRGRGRGQRGRGGMQTQVSKEDLDNQLDVYMSKTKNYLDHELDAYMQQSDM